MISLKSISAYAAKHFELLNHYLRACFDNLIPTFLASNTQNQTYFHAKIPRSFFGFACKDMCYLSYNANVNIIISDFQQKYVEVKSLRRSGQISNILLNKKLICNLSPFQVASLYLLWYSLKQWTYSGKSLNFV